MLAFTRTHGHRHEDSIAVSSLVLSSRLAERGITVDVTEDPAAFTTRNLLRYKAVVFLYTSGNDILDDAGKLAFEAYIRAGGGWLGVHSASDTEYDWPFYNELVGTHYLTHPLIQEAVVHVEMPDHPAVAAVPMPWVELDEWYDFRSNPRDRPGIQILATVDETTYDGGMMGADHPVIWCHETLGGRALYIAPGHYAHRWDEPEYLTVIDGALDWVMQ